MKRHFFPVALAVALAGSFAMVFACSSSSTDSGASCDEKSCAAKCSGGKCSAGVCSCDAPILSWKHLPRSSPCRAYSECPFEVGATGGTGAVDRYEWSFSNEKDAGTITHEPKITHKYGPGAAKTRVTVYDKSGASSALETNDDICVDGVEIMCVADVTSCCFGTCTPSGACR